MPTVLLGVLLVVGCALGFGVLAGTLAEQRSVLVLARPVARGTVLVADDLAVAQVTAGTTIRTLAAEQQDRVLGRALLTSLPEGSALTEGLVAPVDVPIGPTTRTVGLLLEPGGYPTASLAAGDTVSVVDTDGGGTVLAERAAVVRIDPVVDGSPTQLISVVVADGSATAITSAAAEDRVRLLLHGATP